MELQVKALLKEKGMSQKDLANRLNIQPESLSRTLRGNPTLSTLSEIANALEVDICRLFVSNRPYGHIEYGGELHRITSANDLKNLVKKIDV